MELTGSLPLDCKTKRQFVLESSLGVTGEEGVITEMVQHSSLSRKPTHRQDQAWQ